jgi:hypothetical protein
MTDKPDVEATETQADEEAPEVDPDHRFAGLAQPPLSDPAHPDHAQWHHEHAGGPDPNAEPAPEATTTAKKSTKK